MLTVEDPGDVEIIAKTPRDNGEDQTRPQDDLAILHDSFTLIPSNFTDRHRKTSRGPARLQKSRKKEKASAIPFALVVLCLCLAAFSSLELRTGHAAWQAFGMPHSSFTPTNTDGSSRTAVMNLSPPPLDEMQPSKQAWFNEKSRALSQHQFQMEHQHTVQEDSAIVPRETEAEQSQFFGAPVARSKARESKSVPSISASSPAERSALMDRAALPVGSGISMFDPGFLQLPELSAYGYIDSAREDIEFSLLTIPVVGEKVEAGLGAPGREDLGIFMAFEGYMRGTSNNVAVQFHGILLPIIRKAEIFGVAEKVAKERLDAAMATTGPVEKQWPSSVSETASSPQKAWEDLFTFIRSAQRAVNLLTDIQDSLSAGIDQLSLIGKRDEVGQSPGIITMIQEKLQNFALKANAIAEGPVSALRALHYMLKAKHEYILSILDFATLHLEADQTAHDLILHLEYVAYAEHALDRARWMAVLALAKADMPTFLASIV